MKQVTLWWGLLYISELHRILGYSGSILDGGSYADSSEILTLDDKGMISQIIGEEESDVQGDPLCLNPFVDWFFALVEFILAVWLTIVVIIDIILATYDAAATYYGWEIFHWIKLNKQWWRNETFWYYMSYPYFNFTTLNLYDWWNKTSRLSREVKVNFALRTVYQVYTTMSNLTGYIMGPEIVNLLFPQALERRWANWTYTGYMIPLWYHLGLNRSWSELWLNDLDRANHTSWTHFNQYAAIFNRSYSPLEISHRFEIFMENLKLIEEYNKNERGSAKYGLTIFTDLTQREFMMKYTSHVPSYSVPTYHSNNDIISALGPTPDQFDWRMKRVVSSVKNHKLCSGSWAFAVVDCLEAHNAIRQGSLVEFSEQQLIDCDYSSRGCAGGSVTNAYRYIYDAGGLASASAYPYVGLQGNCSFQPKKVSVKVRDTFYSLPQREETMRLFIYNYGPVVATVNAAQLQFYKKGVIRCRNENCNPNQMNHAVNVIGFGVDRSPYWLIKNNWGSAWGEKGYFKLFRGENTLGIRNFVTAPILAP